VGGARHERRKTSGEAFAYRVAFRDRERREEEQQQRVTTSNQLKSSSRTRGARAKDTMPDADIPGCEIRGARTHNLKGISCRIPFGRLTVITGVSGSGKTSLAFDTLYAEGQRRFIDCLSTYARQFLPRLDRPEVESIGELQPPVAVRQQNLIRNARSTVGSITEISDYLELVLAHGGTVHCSRCGAVAETLELDEAAERLLALPEDARWILAAPVRIAAESPRAKPKVRKSPRTRRAKTEPPRDQAWSAESLAALGHTRFLVGGEILESRPEVGTAWLVLDRFTARSLDGQRAHEAIEGAWHLGRGEAALFAPGEPEPRHWLRRGVHCTACGARGERLRPHELSPHSPLGACAACQGFGRIPVVDREKVVPDPRKSLSEGALVPLATKMGAAYLRRILKAAPARGVRLDVPYAELTTEEIEWVWTGSRESPGVLGFFRYLERKRYRAHVRIFQARFRGYLPCGECGGARRRREVLSVKLGGHSILDLETMPIGELRDLIEGLALTEERTQAVASPRRELLARLGYLIEVGLDYLTLARTARTLSGGETQRIRLASGLGSSLSRTLYVLDEPTVGLHATDSARILSVMRHLTARGNTVVVVEHDPEIARAADHLLVLGPSGGEEGGELLYEGPPARFFARDPDYFSVAAHRSSSVMVRERPLAPERRLTLRGVRCHNLDLAEVTLPLDRLVVLTGVSGSGKSTLLEDGIWKQAERAAGRAAEEAAEVASIDGLEGLAECLLLSQDPLGRSSRSTVVSFAGLLDPLRTALARSTVARERRLAPGAFSFNVAGGRCEVCKGMGRVSLDMQFLADVEIACESCRGRRFQEQVLEVTWRGKNILEILELTVREARAFLGELPGAAARIAPLEQIGLDYLRLGQSTSTLSGGEAQRLRIASILGEPAHGPARLYLLDEPTSGLHPRDIARLLDALRALVSRGHGVVVVEHQLDFIRAADWAIDLGPGGGARGGRLVYAGPVAGLGANSVSVTGAALRSESSARAKAASTAPAAPPA